MKNILALALLTSATAPFVVAMSPTSGTEEAAVSMATAQESTSGEAREEMAQASERKETTPTESSSETSTEERMTESSTPEEPMMATESSKMERNDGSEVMSHEEMMNEIMALKEKLRDKVVSLPGTLEKEGTDLKARMLSLYAEALRECGERNFKEGSSALKKYEEAAQRLEEAADALENLPVNRVMKKSFANLDEWMQLKMESHLHKAELLKAVAQDLKDTDLERKAEKFASMVEKFKEKATTEESEEGSQEGCPLTEADDEKDSEETEEGMY